MIDRERIIELAKESGVADWYLGADDLKSATQQRHCAKLEAFANLIAAETRESYGEIESLRQQLATLKSDYCNIDSAADAQAAELYKVKQQLAECQRERDEYLRDLGAMKNWIADWHKKDAELATVTAERDELVVALGRIASSRVVDIAQAALAKLGADKGEK